MHAVVGFAREVAAFAACLRARGGTCPSTVGLVSAACTSAACTSAARCCDLKQEMRAGSHSLVYWIGTRPADRRARTGSRRNGIAYAVAPGLCGNADRTATKKQRGISDRLQDTRMEKFRTPSIRSSEGCTQGRCDSRCNMSPPMLAPSRAIPNSSTTTSIGAERTHKGLFRAAAHMIQSPGRCADRRDIKTRARGAGPRAALAPLQPALGTTCVRWHELSLALVPSPLNTRATASCGCCLL